MAHPASRARCWATSAPTAACGKRPAVRSSIGSLAPPPPLTSPPPCPPPSREGVRRSLPLDEGRVGVGVTQPPCRPALRLYTINDRPIIKWPNNARVAFWVAPNVEFFSTCPKTARPSPTSRTIRGWITATRVGFWRILDVLNKHKVRACIAASTSNCSTISPRSRMRWSRPTGLHGARYLQQPADLRSERRSGTRLLAGLRHAREGDDRQAPAGSAGGAGCSTRTATI